MIGTDTNVRMTYLRVRLYDESEPGLSYFSTGRSDRWRSLLLVSF